MTSRLAGIAKHFFNMGATKSDITLYTVNTPNGIKASILLEELNLDYKVCSRKRPSRLLGGGRSTAAHAQSRSMPSR